MRALRHLLLWPLLVTCGVMLLSGFGGNTTHGGTHLSTNGLGPIRLSAAQYAGEQLFRSTCGSCHTLSAAHTSGRVGPNLDMLRPPAPAVTATINSGLGKMPAHLLKGKREREVVEFVAAVTAH